MQISRSHSIPILFPSGLFLDPQKLQTPEVDSNSRGRFIIFALPSGIQIFPFRLFAESPKRDKTMAFFGEK